MVLAEEATSVFQDGDLEEKRLNQTNIQENLKT